MKIKKSRIITLIVVIAIVGAGAALIGIKKSRLAQAPRYGMSPLVVHTSTAKQGDIYTDLNYLSVAEAFQKANLSSRASAAVIAVNVDEGSPVKKGETIIEMDSKDIHSEIDAVNAQIKQVKADLAASKSTVEALEKSAAYWDREAERDSSLAESGAIPVATAETTVNKADEIKGQRDAARGKTEALNQAVQSLKRKKSQVTAQLSYYILKAPFDGIVTERMVDPGDLASPGKALVTIEDTDRMMLVFDIPQKDLGRISEGLPVTFQSGGETFNKMLSHIYPALSASRMARAEIYIDGPDKASLISGAYVPLTVQVSHMKNTVLLPSVCLAGIRKKKPYVYVVQDNHIHIRPVEILADNGESTAVTGVSTGEQVVVNTFLGWAQLSEGMEVEVIK